METKFTTMSNRKTILMLIFLLHLTAPGLSAGDAETADRLINSSEPAFLQNIGPKNQHAQTPSQANDLDNLWAGIITASAVALIIAHGLDRHDQQNRSNPPRSS